MSTAQEGAISEVAAIAKRCIERNAADIQAHSHTVREAARVRAAAEVAGANVTALRGRRAERPLDFFESPDELPSDADEIVEHALRAASEEVEERKVPCLGYALASLLIDPTVTRSDAHSVIREIRQLSYRQTCALAVVAAGRPIERGPWFEGTELSHWWINDLYDLYGRGLIAALGGGSWLSRSDLAPWLIYVTGSGWDLHRRLRLDLLPRNDLDAAADALDFKRPRVFEDEP